MTRFARADGSKASNKRTYEEATPWEEMKADLQLTKKKKKKESKKKTEVEKENCAETKVENCTVEVSNSGLETKVEKKKKKKKSLENINKNVPEDKIKVETTDTIGEVPNEITEKKLKKKKKIKKEKENNEDVSEENKINDIKNTDSSAMGEVSNKLVFEKKLRKKNKIKKLENSGESKSNDKKSDAVNNEVKKKKKEPSLEEKKKNYVIEDGIKYKIGKKGKKQPWFDLPYEENDVMTRYKNFYVKHDDVVELDAYRKSLEAEGLGEKQMTNKMINRERKAHNQLRLQLLRAEICKTKEQKDGIISKNLQKKFKIPKTPKEPKPEYNRKKLDLKYEENEMMTMFDGYWVLRDNLQHVKFIDHTKRQRVIEKRTDGNKDPEFSAEEDLEYRRLMKKERRREERLLKLKLIEITAIETKSDKFRKKKPGKYLGIDYKENTDMVKFDGFYIKKDAAQRLNKLRDLLLSKGCTEDEIWRAMKSERRKEERVLKNEKKLFCFKCRSVGHMVSSCPELVEGNDKGIEFCFKCGSTEHMARNCPKNVGAGPAYSHATCFICGEVGHISRECPDNPKGLYPNGGCCNECGSVEHLKRDCPELQQRFEENTMRASRFQYGEEVEGLEQEVKDEVDLEPAQKNKKKTPKVIKFD